MPLSLAREKCEEGDEITVCGFPLGDNLISQHPSPYFSPTFSAGIVSASLSFAEATPDTRTHFRMDIMVNPGNSGGPVFDQYTGEVVGIVSDTIEDFAAVQKGESQDSTTEDEEQQPSDYIYLPIGLSHGVHALPWAESLIERVKEKLLRR